MRAELITQRADFDNLADSWNSLLAQDAQCPTGMDATGSHEWASAVIDTFLQDGQWIVVVAVDESGIAGILPLYWTRHRWPKAGRGMLDALTEVNGGRNGFLLRPGSEETALSTMVTCLRSRIKWDRLNLRLVSGSRSASWLGDLCARENMLFVKGGADAKAATSPYLALPDDLEGYLRSLNASFRWQLQRRERRLRDAGAIQLEIVETPEQVSRYLAAVDEIERQSWKEDAGSSITARDWEHRFYQALLPRVAASGLLLSTLLRLDRRPIAYQMVTAFGETASLLKTSYVQDLRAYSPGIVLQWMQLREIHARGFRSFDFMGACEPYKLRWTESVYSRHTYCLFNRSLAGRIAEARHKVGSAVKHRVSRA